MPCLPRSNIHLDILMGRDEEVDFHDVFGGTHDAFFSARMNSNLISIVPVGRPSAPPLNIHADMERKLRM